MFRELSITRLSVSAFLLALVIYYTQFFLKYFFFDGGIWSSVSYALLGAFVISQYGLTAVLITLSYSSLGRVSKKDSGRIIAPLIALSLTFIFLFFFLTDFDISWTTPSFLVLFGILGYWIGRSNRISHDGDQKLIDAGLIICIILVTSEVCEHILSNYDVWDWSLLFCALAYAIPLGLIGLLLSSFERAMIWRVIFGFGMALEIMLLFIEPFLPVRILGVVIIPYIQVHIQWAFYTWVLASLAIITGLINVKYGYSSLVIRSKSLFIEGFVGAFVYSMLTLTVWRYPQESGVQEIVLVVSTIWIALFFGSSPYKSD